MAGYCSISILPDDLIREISQCFLATNDLDAYVDFRAACRDWRRVIPNPRADAKDPKFIPTKWIMARHSLFEDGKVTFVNLSTGRSICKDISLLLGRYFFIGVAAGGLLVLGEQKHPYQTRVVNPFTGAMVHFEAGIPWDKVEAVAVTLSPMRVFASSPQRNSVRWIDETTEESMSGWGFHDKWFGASQGCLVGMTPFAGDLYTTDVDGSIISATDAAAAEKDQRQQLLAILSLESYAQECHGNYFYLVESEGELLFVMECRLPFYNGGPLVYKVDAVNKVLVPVWSLGSQALFVSKYRCLSVDASKLETVEEGSIYYADYSMIIAYDYEIFPDDGWVEKQPKNVVQFHPNHEDYNRPFSLAQILVDYCRTAEHE